MTRGIKKKFFPTCFLTIELRYHPNKKRPLNSCIREIQRAFFICQSATTQFDIITTSLTTIKTNYRLLSI